MEVHIPKIIMQTWKTNILPDEWKISQTSIYKHMSSWKYVLLTDDDNRNFITEHFPDFLSYYDKFPYNIQRADAIRYCWLYINGGLYIDCDYEFLKPLDDLFTENHNLYLLHSAETSKIITNSIIASKPHQKIWLDMIDHMKKPAGIYNITKYTCVMYTTGPCALNNIVNKNNYKYKQLDSKVLNPYSCCFKEHQKIITNDMLLKQLEGGSWVKDSFMTVCIKTTYCNCKYLFILFMIMYLTVLIIKIID